MSLTKEDLLLIGGSDAAAIAGVSRYKTPLDIFRRIVEGHTTETTRPQRRGQLLEEPIRQMYREETGAKLLGPLSLRGTFTRASLDDHTEDRVVEIKSANIRQAHEWGELGTDEVPTDYLVQVQWYMRHARKEMADLVVLLGGDELRVYPIRADVEMQEMLWEAAERFWKDHVLPKRPPEIDDTQACHDWLTARFPRDVGPVVPSTPDAELWAHRLFTARANLDEAEALEREARNHLQALIGDAAGMVGSGWRISWKGTKPRTSVDWEAVALAAGASMDLIAQHTTTKPGPRVFRCTGPKE